MKFTKECQDFFKKLLKDEGCDTVVLALQADENGEVELNMGVDLQENFERIILVDDLPVATDEESEEALKEATFDIKDGEIYVSLDECCHDDDCHDENCCCHHCCD